MLLLLQCIDKPQANPTSHFKAMFSPQMLAGIVGRQEGWEHVFPFSSLMCEWTDGAWPYEGSFEKEMNVNPNVGNPSWNFGYMKECMQRWLTVAHQQCGIRVSKGSKWGSDELREMVEQSAKAMMYGRGKADRERDRKAAGLEERAKGARAQDSSETSDSESEEQRATQKKEELNTEHSAEAEHVVTPKTTQTQTCPETAHDSRCQG